MEQYAIRGWTFTDKSKRPLSIQNNQKIKKQNQISGESLHQRNFSKQSRAEATNNSSLVF